MNVMSIYFCHRKMIRANSPALDDMHRAELIYLLISNDHRRLRTSYADSIPGFGLLETMVVDSRERITDARMTEIDEQINGLAGHVEDTDYPWVLWHWIRRIQMSMRDTDFPFHFVYIDAYLSLSDTPEELPNFDIVKHWKHIDGCCEYECFQTEWLRIKHTLPLIVCEPLYGSRFATVSHVLAKSLRWLPCDAPYAIDIAKEYIPYHLDELNTYDVNEKIPIEWLSEYSTDEMKNIFKQR